MYIAVESNLGAFVETKEPTNYSTTAILMSLCDVHDVLICDVHDVLVHGKAMRAKLFGFVYTETCLNLFAFKRWLSPFNDKRVYTHLTVSNIYCLQICT